MAELCSPWRGRRVLVTGCTGFLGGAVVAELIANEAEVVGLVRDRAAAAAFARHQLTGRVRIVHGRVDDLFRVHSALAVHEAQAVFHLIPAAPFGPDRGTATVLEAVRRYDPRVSVVVARTETAAPIPSSPAPLGVARFGELFGNDAKTHRFVAATAIGLLDGTRGPVFAERGARDYVHVRDAARACLLLAEALTSRPIPHVQEAHFHSGWLHTDREMQTAIREACEDHSPPVSYPAPPANPLGWSPSLNFADAIADTVEWYREFVRSRASGVRSGEPVRAAA